MDNGIPSLPPGGVTSEAFDDLGGVNPDFGNVGIDQLLDQAAFEEVFNSIFESLITTIIADNLLPDPNEDPFSDQNDGVIKF